MVNNIETGLPNGDPSHAAFAARQSAKAVGRSGEDANGLDEEHPGATDAQSQKRLALKKQAVESLSVPTRKYLHVNVQGKGIPVWMDWDKQPELNKWNYYKDRLHTLMTDASSSVWALVVSNVMVITILVSTTSFCLETIPSFSEDRNPSAARTFTLIETVTIQIFALDYLLRFFSAPVKLKFLIEPFNIIDIISIVPWYIITFVGADFNGTTVFRVARLFRVFRVFKLGGRYGKLLVVLGALRKSMDMLFLMVFFISLCIVFFSTLEYYAERGDWDEELGYYVRPLETQFYDTDPPTPKPSPFSSIVQGFWWAIVTLMTVGYGDVIPVSAAGKFIASVAMICGVLSLALPISVVGTTFSNDWEAHVADERRRMAVTHRKSLVVTSPALLRLHKLLTRHLNHVDVLGDLNRASELALDDAASSIHGRVKATKKHLHTEAKADLRLRKAAKQRVDPTLEYDRQYGYLPAEHVQCRYREPLPHMADAADQLSRRAFHVMRMESVNAALLDPVLAATVARLAKKHADLQFLLSKFEEKVDPLAILEAELSYLQSGVREAHELNAAVGLMPPPTLTAGASRKVSTDALLTPRR
ncbi:hypothetical protein CHLRE_10g432550v5 [Chlamydomonas reinhardtii]|uniref:Ion transport domain-containing protein n=1 Tax=Chlamydomonas reinhardtii TaxID=3055 RepID=A8IB39_CHLRE|nr:uncharacterized protein CHLRE_10g432550v5 [Chlamydomonas reinhardtii]PNW77345.1 hypothetical protein CHLRE_10g432550v5 [Chlamydomonas reinhardtii]|eukprot:XP_001702666.1 predicted protein [Chlamydomonas reinhardtii]